jgi:AcrR family transcriptional regulator
MTFVATSSPARHRVRWVGLPPDARRAQRRALLLDAAFDLLGTLGSDGTTVRAVCQRARLNPRYFYESFGDLDALVVAVYDRVVDELAAVVLGAETPADLPPRARLRAAVERTVRFVDDDRRRGRVLYVEALGNEALNRRRRQAGHMLVGLVAGDHERDGGRDHERDGGRDHERDGGWDHGRDGGRGGVPLRGRDDPIARISAAILVGGLGELVSEWLEGRIDVPGDQLVEDTTDLLLALGQATAGIAARRCGRMAAGNQDEPHDLLT